ncbi:MAG: hypothetical protein JSR98_03975 [Proteobacteria bacterium]|nr:hypothetical protein [Pseudomonadota bacterium]
MSASNSDTEAPATDSPWPPSTWDLPLRHPVHDAAGGLIDILHLREPTDDEWVKAYEHPPETRRRFIVSTVCGVPMQTVAKIGVGDLEVAARYLSGFFDVATEIRPWSQQNSLTSTAGTP